jgi:hypothetical protein
MVHQLFTAAPRYKILQEVLAKLQRLKATLGFFLYCEASDFSK